MRRYGMVLLLLLISIAGCSPLNLDRDIQSITLVCSERALNGNCVGQYYEDRAIIKTFVKAMESAKKMEGKLDYQEEYELIANFKDGEQRRFHLSLTKNRGYKGLLLELPNTMQGYSISKENANQLRDIIYGK